jgi:hypothetical protein
LQWRQDGSGWRQRGSRPRPRRRRTHPDRSSDSTGEQSQRHPAGQADQQQPPQGRGRNRHGDQMPGRHPRVGLGRPPVADGPVRVVRDGRGGSASRRRPEGERVLRGVGSDRPRERVGLSCGSRYLPARRPGQPTLPTGRCGSQRHRASPYWARVRTTVCRGGWRLVDGWVAGTPGTLTRRRSGQPRRGAWMAARRLGVAQYVSEPFLIPSASCFRPSG